MRREAGPLAAVRVILDTRVWGEATGEGPPSLVISTECDFDCLTLSYPMTRLEPGLYELAPADAEAFLIESQYGLRAVTRFPGGEEHSIVSTDGLSAALRWIDETQQQAGTVTAVLAYGETAASTVPPPPERPMVPVVRAIADQEFALVDRPDLAEWQRQHCRATTSDADLPVQQFLLGNGQALWSLPCGSGPYREVRLWLVELDAGELGLHLLPRPDVASVAEPPVLRNSRFDMQSGMLTSNSGGLCGWQRRWAWTGQAFAMIDSIEMPACHDILPHNWLQTYRAVPD